MKKILLASFTVLIPNLLLADMVWPGLILWDFIVSLYVIPFSIIIEFLFFWWAFRLCWWRTIIATVIANFASSLLGWFPIIATTFGGEHLICHLSRPLANILSWGMAGMICVIINTLIETYTIKLLYFERVTLSRKIWILVGIANIITVYLAYIAQGIYPKSY